MHLSIFNFKPIKWTLIFFVVLSTGVGSLKIWSINQTEPALRPLPSKFWLDKTFAPSVFDMVIIGDSRVYRAVAPSIMEQVLSSYKILNFAYSSGGLQKVLFQAGESKLRNLGKKIIVLGVSPYSLTQSAAVNEQYKQYHKMFALPFRIPNLLMLISPEESIFSIKRLFMKQEALKYYQIPHPDGWIESNQVPENELSGLNEYQQRFSKEKISNEVLKEMIEQVRIWKSRGYTVFAFRPPASQKMEELENTKSGYDEKSIVQAFTEAGGTWINIENRYQYKTYDGSHLNSTSAKLLSDYIARFIKQSMDQNISPMIEPHIYDNP